MVKIKVGCCGFPLSKRTYAQTFSVVELQQTFYEPPQPKIALKWRQEVPGNFEYTLKAWQLITHTPQSPTYKKLKQPIPKDRQDCYGNFKPTPEVMAAWRKTKEIAEILKARIIIFQSPASFRPTPENKKNLRDFFGRIDRDDFLLGWEARGQWTKEEIDELCQELELIDVVDPFIRPPVTAGLKYFRLHGIGGYRYRYSDEDLEKIMSWIEGSNKDIYVMFNNVYMYEDACRFKSMLSKRLDS